MAVDYGHGDYCGCGDPGGNPRDDDRYDEPDWDDYPAGDYDDSPEPDWDREEYYRYLDLPWFGRLVYDLRVRLKVRARWRKLTGRADDWSDEPPF